MKIGSQTISNEDPAYIIAEIGLNHQGDIQLAKQLIDAAVAANANCAKFQKRSLKKVYKADVLEHVEKEEQGGQYILKNLIKCELDDQSLKELSKYCHKQNIDFMCTPWDEDSLAFLAELDVSAYKIGSPDMTNLLLLRQVAMLKKPILISTGMSFVSEIEQVARYLNELNAEFLFLHCNSTYPAPYNDINLLFLQKLKQLSNGLVGYSGHERGISVSLAAVSLGAKIIEKHLTLDRTLEGPDHRASLEPQEFVELVKQIRIVESCLGEETRFMSRGEYLNRQVLSKSLVAAKDLKKGHTLQFSDISVKSPGKGTSPLKINHFLGKTLIARSIKKDDYLLESDVDTRPVEYNTYASVSTKHSWGVVARMSDVNQLLPCNSTFMEIHLTDSDINSHKTYTEPVDRHLVVHGPEYNDNLLLDLSSLDEGTRAASVSFFNKAFAHARSFKQLFKNNKNPTKFVIHPGGFAMSKPLFDKKTELYQQLEKSLHELNTTGFEPLIENMPSCPWFFGGQWFCTTFMDADEIVNFSKKTGYGVVWDVSHAALYCNYYKKDLMRYAKTILPVTKYIHISDASGFNGEGLQIGDGTIDFEKIVPLVVKEDFWILPEVWQGHKFNGEGFLKAINKLKSMDADF